MRVGPTGQELTDAGLIEARTEGRSRLLHARNDVIAEYIEMLGARVLILFSSI